MKTKIYITTQTFSALTSFLQKGLEQKMKFFIDDRQNLIQNRLWTFSSTVFLPNVKEGDSIIKKYQVPVIINTNMNHGGASGYHHIMYEPINVMLQDNQDIYAIFIQNKTSTIDLLKTKKIQNYDIFIKNENKWVKITSLQP